MAKPTRAFRGADIAQERQMQPLYKALDAGIDAGNLAKTGVMPLMTMAITGGAVATLASAIAWWPTSFSFASSTAVQTLQVTHSLGRAPVGFLDILPNAANATMAAASTGQWNATAATFAIVSTTTSVNYRIILL